MVYHPALNYFLTADKLFFTKVEIILTVVKIKYWSLLLRIKFFNCGKIMYLLI